MLTYYLQQARHGRDCECPSTDEWIKKMWYIYIHTHTHTMENKSAIRNNEIMPFAATWMNLEMIILSKSEKEKYHMISFICGF